MSTTKSLAVMDKFPGLDLNDGAKPSFCSAQENISLRRYPFLATGTGMEIEETYSDFDNITDVFYWEGLWVVDSNKLYHDGREISVTLLPGRKQFAVVNGYLILWPDKLMVSLADYSVATMEKSVDSGASFSYTASTLSFTAGTVPVIVGDATRNTYRSNFSALSPTVYSYGTDKSKIHFSGGVWSFDVSPTAKSIVRDPQTTVLTPGEIFIVDSNYQPVAGDYRKSTNPDTTKYNTEGYYGVLRSINGTWPWGKFDYSVHVIFDIYKAGAGTYQFSEVFDIGDRVDISGFALSRNNVQGAKILGIQSDSTDNKLTFAENTFFRYDYCYTVTGSETWNESYFPRLKTAAGSNLCNFPDKTYIVSEQNMGHFVCAAGTKITLLWDSSLSKYSTHIFYPDGTDEDGGSYSVTTTGPYFYAVEDTVILAKRPVPAMDYICAHENRLWGVSNMVENEVWDELLNKTVTVKSRVIFASALGLPYRFYDFDGADTDSYSVAVGSEGDFTAVLSYSGDVLCFKEAEMCRVSGGYPSAYRMYSYQMPGVREGCFRSVAAINKYLYYVSRNGVQYYYGGRAYLCSERLGDREWQNAVACGLGQEYILAAEDGDGNYGLYAYAVNRDGWSCREVYRYTAMATDGKAAYLLSEDNNVLYKTTEEPSGSGWSFTLAPFRDDGFRTLCLTDLYIRCSIPEGGYMEIDIKPDEGKTISEKILSKPGTGNYRIPLYDMRAESVLISMNGYGNCVIEKIALWGAYGSEEGK